MNPHNLEDELARKLVHLLGREPELSADICTRLEHARRQALARRAQVVAVGQGTAALAPWWLRHMWFAVTTTALVLCAAFIQLCSTEQPPEGLSPGWTYHSEAEASPALESAE